VMVEAISYSKLIINSDCTEVIDVTKSATHRDLQLLSRKIACMFHCREFNDVIFVLGCVILELMF
jgi:hypothetical protein